MSLAYTALIVPGARLEPALDGDLLALAEVRAGDLGEAVPGHHRVVLRLLLAVPDELVRGDGERRDVLATGEAAHLGVGCEAYREHDLVHAPVLLPGRPVAPVTTLRLRREDYGRASCRADPDGPGPYRVGGSAGPAHAGGHDET